MGLSDYDKFITKEPEDNFTPFVEQVYNEIPEDIFDQMELDNFIDSEYENKWLNHFFDHMFMVDVDFDDEGNPFEVSYGKYKSTKQVADILVRAYKIYCK